MFPTATVYHCDAPGRHLTLVAFCAVQGHPQRIAMYDNKDSARDEREAYVRGHPIRVRILELREENGGRPLTAADLQRELDDLPRPTLAMIAYHFQVLEGYGFI